MAFPLTLNSILVPSSESWSVNSGASRTGGRTFTNQEQAVAGPTGYVTASVTIPCNTRAKVLAMRALLAGLDGRAGTLLIGPFEVSRAPWAIDPLTGGKITYCRGANDAASDPAWALNADTSATLDFRLLQPAGLNATRVAVTRARGGIVLPGQFFSIANRLHLVTSLDVPDLGGASVFPMDFRPWLREAHPAGTPIEFGRPICLMRLASDDTGAMELQLSRFGIVTLDLVEAF